MEIQRKLKQDFEFYSSFTESIRQFSKQEDNYLSEAWVQKLLEEQYIGMGNQYNRNIFLANLIICIQKGKLSGPFTEYPPDYGLPNAINIFGTSSTEIKDPAWLNSVVDNDAFCNVRATDKRTYLATKNVPNGKGALGYIAVSLAEGEPQWIQKEGGFFENRDYISKSDKNEKNQHNFERSCPSVEKPIRYYRSILREINKELSGSHPYQENESVDRLIKLLEATLINKGLLQQNDHHSPENKRRIFLKILQEKIKKLLAKQTKSNVIPTDTENNISDPTERRIQRFATGDSIRVKSKKVKKFESTMSVKHLKNKLKEIYPEIIVERFLYYLAKDKQDITKKIKEHHNKIVAQIIKDLQQEYNENQKKCDDSQYALDEIKNILMKFKQTAEQAELVKQEIEEENLRKHREHEENYVRLKQHLLESQKLLAEEEKRKLWLNENINNMEKQTKRYKKFNKENLKKIEDSNMVIFKDIGKLTREIGKYENNFYARPMY